MSLKIPVLIVVLLAINGCMSTARTANTMPVAQSAIVTGLQGDVEVGADIKETATLRILLGLFSLTPDVNSGEADVGFVTVNGIQSQPQELPHFFGSFLSSIPPLKYWTSAEQIARKSAIYKAVVNSGADVLVHPRFITTVEDYLFYKTVTVTVVAKVGKLKNLRNMVPLGCCAPNK